MSVLQSRVHVKLPCTSAHWLKESSIRASMRMQGSVQIPQRRKLLSWSRKLPLEDRPQHRVWSALLSTCLRFSASACAILLPSVAYACVAACHVSANALCSALPQAQPAARSTETKSRRNIEFFPPLIGRAEHAHSAPCYPTESAIPGPSEVSEHPLGVQSISQYC